MVIFLVLIGLSILYQRYLEKQSNMYYMDTDNAYQEMSKYLLSNESLEKSKKPILWIHIPYEYNSRNWLSFGSRSSFELNQPYLYLTVKSIIKNCDESFKIVLIDDGSFEKLIPGWNIQMDRLASPTKDYVRTLAMAKLIYRYGGMNVPISFLCFRDLIGLYRKGTNNDSMFVCENYDKNISSTTNMFYPNDEFMGANKENPTVKNFIHYVEETVSNDHTAQSVFLGKFSKWCNDGIQRGKIRLIAGTDVGTRTIQDDPVLVEDLFGEDYIQFYGKTYGIWIPHRMLMKRRHYEWFLKMSPEQIFHGHFILAKYFVLTLAPDSELGVIEPMENKPNWISFWRVPLTNGTLDVWGPMPQNLGNNVPREGT